MRIKTILFAAIAATMMAGGVSAASAAPVTGTPAANWAQTHPRRDEVNDRLATQHLRINRERREGEIGRRRAVFLHAEDRGIRAQERYFARHDHGHITRAEKIRLNQEENRLNHQIGR